MRAKSLFLLMVLFTACKETSVNEPPPVDTTVPVHLVRDIPADTGAVGRFTYFSLKDSVVVNGVDTTTNKWDVAFAATTIRTNSGTSGSGMGAAIVLTNADFDTISAAPASGYAYDTSATQLAIRSGSSNGWYNYNFATNIITPIAGRVLMIRTGDGKYAKVQIVSYYQGAPSSPTPTDKPRFYTFRYVYQADGSRRLR